MDSLWTVRPVHEQGRSGEIAALPEVIQLFSNPAAGRHRRRAIAALVKAFEAQGATVLRSESSAGMPVIAAEATHVCVAGGDGTVRHVGDAVVRAGHLVTMSIYPAGTINLLAREAGYPRDPAAFATLVLSGPARRKHYPVAMAGGHFFACASVGPDSLAVARVSRRLKQAIGRIAYGIAALKLLYDWQRVGIVLEVGERNVACEAFYVAKARYYAGGWSFARDARVNEPVLHVVALRTARRRDYLAFLAVLAAGRDVSKLANVVSFTCSTLRAEAAAPLPIQADGDVVGTMPATIALREDPLIFC
jgi:diacylglycerol kinase family enzyme